ncbi:MAG: ABC transporter ATP-binding protein [Desulfurispora sp.]|uniref:ABC transporter ATP-binding protein n=1 Tax=Desulfurispora sp. TaxID=3014275 RepID=UPI00404B7E2A
MAPLLAIEKLVCHTGRGEDGRRVELTAALSAGAVLVVRGPSGAGKSTVLKALARLKEAAGTVRLAGVDWQQIPPPLWRRRVHYLAQQPALFAGSVLDNLKRPFELAEVKKYGAFEESLVRDALPRLNLAPALLDQEARTISGGEAARIALLRAMLIGPQVLLLDEPTAALDEESRRAVLQYIGEWLAVPGRAAILVSHREEDAGFFSRRKVVEISPRGEQNE